MNHSNPGKHAPRTTRYTLGRTLIPSLSLSRCNTLTYHQQCQHCLVLIARILSTPVPSSVIKNNNHHSAGWGWGQSCRAGAQLWCCFCLRVCLSALRRIPAAVRNGDRFDYVWPSPLASIFVTNVSTNMYGVQVLVVGSSIGLPGCRASVTI